MKQGDQWLSLHNVGAVNLQEGDLPALGVNLARKLESSCCGGAVPGPGSKKERQIEDVFGMLAGKTDVS